MLARERLRPDSGTRDEMDEMGSSGGNYGDDKVDFGIHLDVVLVKVRNVFRVSVFVCYLSLNIAKHIP